MYKLPTKTFIKLYINPSQPNSIIPILIIIKFEVTALEVFWQIALIVVYKTNLRQHLELKTILLDIKNRQG